MEKVKNIYKKGYKRRTIMRARVRVGYLSYTANRLAARLQSAVVITNSYRRVER